MISEKKFICLIIHPVISAVVALIWRKTKRTARVIHFLFAVVASGLKVLSSVLKCFSGSGCLVSGQLFAGQPGLSFSFQYN